ncbi:MAG: PEP-CTERM sorting domain-containing protein, partial [Alphaproteobacteria bacterium]|nr:PEP-CTERM sorting domain-containing protein [Alphaproteobacteria bacterium]
ALGTYTLTLLGTVVEGGGTDVPVPATWTLFGVGAAALVAWRRRRGARRAA